MNEPTFSIVDPRAKLPCLEQTAQVQREVDDGLRVMWDAERRKYVVLDSKAPGGPDSSYVLLVQEPDGSYRPFDQRTIDTLRKLRRENHDFLKAELEKREEARQAGIVRNRQNTAEALAKDFRWIGSQWTPSVGWRDRSEARETIRKEAASG